MNVVNASFFKRCENFLTLNHREELSHLGSLVFFFLKKKKNRVIWIVFGRNVGVILRLTNKHTYLKRISLFNLRLPRLILSNSFQKRSVRTLRTHG